MTKEEAWEQYYESNPSLFDSGLDEIDLAKIQESFYYAFDLCNKENAELKEKNRQLDSMLTGESLVSNERKEQLTKAKEYLRILVQFAKATGLLKDEKIAEVEQFLSEVEK